MATMNRERRDLLSIGTFADAAQLSMKALRLYARLDLLKPAYTDPASGYRYYQTDQLEAARLIRMMRQMDMPLATIQTVLAADTDEAERLVIAYWRSLEQRLEVARVTVQDLICALKGEPVMSVQAPSLHIEARTLQSQHVVSITTRVLVDKLDGAILAGIEELQGYLAAQKVESNGAPFGIFHGAINYDSDGPIEICLPTPTLLSGTETIQARTVPGGAAAFVSMTDGQCAYPEVLKGYDALVDWMTQNGYERAGSPREEWATFPDIEGQMDVYWLYREKRPV